MGEARATAPAEEEKSVQKRRIVSLARQEKQRKEEGEKELCHGRGKSNITRSTSRREKRGS